MISSRRSLLKGLAASGLAIPLPAGRGHAAAPPRRSTLFGVNCYDLYNDYLHNPRQVKDPVRRLEELARQQIPFVRFAAGPHWPNSWVPFDKDPESVFSRLDRIIRGAETVGIQLVPTLIWSSSGLSDHMGEPVSAWGDAQSRTRTHARHYARQIISRYKGSPAILAWEASNEFNSFVNRQESERFWPPVNIARGTPAERTAADRIGWRHVAGQYTDIAEIVHSLDPGRSYSTGANIPRAYMMNAGEGRKTPDTPAQYAKALELSLAGNADMLSLHLYAHALLNRFGDSGEAGYLRMVQIARQVADVHSAKLFVGEFGVRKSDNPEADKAEFQRQMAAIREGGADYAAIWVYDLGFSPEWSVTASNDRSWQLDLLRHANK